ncbi:MAG: metallophosphoesterase family protein [Candidatus Heimdallarchaeota archaeon]
MNLKEPQLEQPNIFALRDLAEDFIQAFAAQLNVVSWEKPARTMIIGDLHGDLKATKQAFKLSQTLRCDRIILLGDYVDRGSDQLAVLEYVLKMTLTNPDSMILLRGNHEDETMNSKYGFHRELRMKFPTPAVFEEAVRYCLEIYDHMSLAAQTPSSLFLHGGIPQNATMQDIENIPKPHSKLAALKSPGTQKLSRIFEEIRWNDPDETLSSSFGASSRGDSVKRFSCIEAENFLRQKAERHRLFRSHESSRGPFASLWDGLVVHILTSDLPPIISSSGVDVQDGAVAIENEKGFVNVVKLNGVQIASFPPRRWTRSSVCE